MAFEDFTDGNDLEKQRGGSDRKSNCKVVRQLFRIRSQDKKIKDNDWQLHKRNLRAKGNQLAASMDQSDFDVSVVSNSVHRDLTLELSGNEASCLE